MANSKPQLSVVDTAGEIHPAEDVAPETRIKFEETVSKDDAEVVPDYAALLLALAGEGEEFTKFAAGNSVTFLDLADLDPVKTVESLRGESERDIQDKIQVANSFIVIAYWYADTKGDDSLKDAAMEYAKKMRTIMARIGIKDFK